jgi:two-component system chemotaxis response regulator CheB
MPYQVVAVGGSRGGSQALAVLLSRLPGDFTVPVVAALHRCPESAPALIQKLRAESALPVVEAEDKDPLGPGRVYVAPPGYHLLVERGNLALSTEGLVSRARPSIDVLFESAADAWGSQVIGVVLSGSSSDGAAGLARIKRSGGLTVVQQPETAEARTMPEAALRAAPADRVLPLAQIAPFLVRICGRK